ncbi:PAS domain-containing protein [Sphingomonas lutea]|uniref:histidine kinase n=2 Tax=Sphingomonas lutea TaxID=1045317 RepID=A0A7G9SIZ4_9SPHN|nr:PAS domain-containing protein [Sphingomonas lutea]QNN67819.1 PAS domain-containing protein [Sphingomonas lutea]
MGDRGRDDSDVTGRSVPPGFDFGWIRGIADALPNPIAYIDRERRYTFINRAFAEFFERPRRELLGLTVEELLGPEVYAVRKPMFEAAFGGERQWFAADFDHPTRGPLALQAEYVPQPGPDGAVHGIVALITDVTEQRAAERALKESEERFRRIANSAPALMWVTRIDRVRDFVNDAYVEFVCGPHCTSDAERETARTTDWRARIHPDDVDRIVAESLAGEASLQSFTLEGRYLRHDGEYRWLRSVSQPRFSPDGELVGFIGVAGDITLAKEAELELRRQVAEQTAQLAASEAQFRAVFEAALEVMVLLKPDGTVIAVNNRREVWRHPHPDEAIGQKLWDAPTLSAYPQHREHMKQGIAAAARGEVFTTEVKMERTGVPTAFLDVSVQPVRGSDGEVVYLLFEARDLTELKTAQEQLRQSQKMEALGQLTGGIAHDFNNLLTVVVGGLDVITKRTEDDKLKRYADNALAAAERGARLTGQLLAFSRVQRLEVRPTLVAPLIQNMRPLLRNVLGPGIEKRFDLDGDAIPVMADPTQLEVAVLNLAINARDAMPDGGILSFATRKVEVRDDPDLEDGTYIALTITDTGEGMAEDVAARAFDPFFTTKDVGKGTGLGLSMVYGMARQSGGAARIASRPGHGTSVELLFRAAEGASEAEAAAPVDGLATPSERMSASVLVIDDDPDVRGFVVATLEEQGYSVREAADGRAGLAEMDREAPDLVVLDFIMPGLSGAEVASRILSQRPDQPILFVSGYSETDAVKRVAPDAPLLAKPFRADALDKAVRGALSKS